MKKSLQLLLGIGFAAIVFAGCQSMTYRIDPDQGTMLGKPSSASVGYVEEETTAHYMFWGLTSVGKPDLNEVAAKAGVGPDRIMADIKVTETNSFVDGFLAAITLGIYRPRSIEITGKLYNREGLTYVQ